MFASSVLLSVGPHVHAFMLSALPPSSPLPRRRHRAVDPFLGDVLADFVFEADDRLHNHEFPFVDVLERGAELLLRFVLQDALVHLEYLVAWVLHL